jgi:RNA polymerase sigma factor (TIGR02999 family)
VAQWDGISRSYSPAEAASVVEGEEASGSQGADEQDQEVRRSLDELYAKLRAMARVQMAGERRHHTLQATAVVHEAYLRLQRRLSLKGTDRALWLAAAADEMRRVLVDHARARDAQKRGGGKLHSDVDLGSLAQLVDDSDSTMLVALDEAFSRLKLADARAADVVRLRFYLGFTVDETAEALGLSRRSVLRDWEFARAFLLARLTQRE